MRFIRFPHYRKFILLSSPCNFVQQSSSPASNRFSSPWPASNSSASAWLVQSYFCLSRCPCRTFQSFFCLKFLWQDVRGRERWGGRKGQPVSPTTGRARFVLAVLQPAGLDGGALSRGEQIPLLTLAVLICMWAFITCVGTEQRCLQMKNIPPPPTTVFIWRDFAVRLFSCSGSCLAAHRRVFTQKHSTLRVTVQWLLGFATSPRWCLCQRIYCTNTVFFFQKQISSSNT